MGSKEAVEKDGIQELMRIYVKFHDEAEKHPELKMDDEARLWFVKMQEGDEEALTLWKWFYDISIKEFERVYEMLGVKLMRTQENPSIMIRWMRLCRN